MKHIKSYKDPKSLISIIKALDLNDARNVASLKRKGY